MVDIEVASLMEGERFSYGHFNGRSLGLFNGGGMVILERWAVLWREWSCYGGGQFKGGRMVMLQRWSV